MRLLVNVVGMVFAFIGQRRLQPDDAQRGAVPSPTPAPGPASGNILARLPTPARHRLAESSHNYHTWTTAGVLSCAILPMSWHFRSRRSSTRARRLARARKREGH